jgi:hypothetical protein
MKALGLKKKISEKPNSTENWFGMKLQECFRKKQDLVESRKNTKELQTKEYVQEN